MTDQILKEIKVIGVEKPQKGKFQEHYEYVIRVTYENGCEHLIFRRYSMLFHFHSVLKEVVKQSYSSVIILPELPVARFQHVGRKLFRLGMNKELKQMTEFCQKIIVLPKFISEKDIILKFFDQLGTDVAHAEAYQEESQKGEQTRDQSDRLPPTPTESNVDMGQDNEDQYRSIAEFAGDTGELSVVEGEIVTVIEKNTSGWWLVSNQSGVTGFTPATFLEPVVEKANNEEWHEVTGPDNIFEAVKDYEAQCLDEISFRCGDEMEVLSMSNFGWWQVRRNDKTGLCPASSLTLKQDFSIYEDPMIEYRKSILKYSKKLSAREAPPRTSSTKSTDSQSSGDGSSKNDAPCYGNVHYPEPERFSPEDSSVKYTKIIPRHLRVGNEPNNNEDKEKISYVNVPVIKNGTPHYLEGRDSEPINVHIMRKDYEKNGFMLREGDLVQVITVMPDGCFWKVATINPPFKEGLIPSDLLCPELPQQVEDTNLQCRITRIEESKVGDNFEPIRVLPRFTAPPSVRRPVPAPRSNAPRSPTVKIKGTAVVALVDYNPGQTDLLAFQKGDVGRLVKKADTGWWFIELKGFEGWVPVKYWEEVKEGRNGKTPSDVSLLGLGNEWLCGKMTRDQCEVMFVKRGKHLDFMIRKSVQRVGSYALSIKFNDKVHHFPIEKTSSGKFNIGKLSFANLSEIVTHYSIHPLFYTDNRQPVSVGRPLSRT